MSAKNSSSDAPVPDLTSTEFPALPDPAGIASSVTEDDPDLLRALEESLRFASANDDPALSRALTESKDDLIAQQRTIFAEFEPRHGTEAALIRQPQVVESGSEKVKNRPRRRAVVPVNPSEILGFYTVRDVDRYGSHRSDQKFMKQRGRAEEVMQFDRGKLTRLSLRNGDPAITLRPNSLMYKPYVEAERPADVDDAYKTYLDKSTSKKLQPNDNGRGEGPRNGGLGNAARAAQKNARDEKLSIVVDAENVGLEYGCGNWNARGVEVALAHLQMLGSSCVAVLPAHVEAKASENCQMILKRIRKRDSGVLRSPAPSNTSRLDLLEHAVCASDEYPVALLSNYDFRQELRDIVDEDVQCIYQTFLSNCLMRFSWNGDVFVPGFRGPTSSNTK